MCQKFLKQVHKTVKLVRDPKGPFIFNKLGGGGFEGFGGYVKIMPFDGDPPKKIREKREIFKQNFGIGHVSCI